MAMAVIRAWILMFSSPLRMAPASPWSGCHRSRHRFERRWRRGAVRAFDPPSVAGVDRVVVFTPCRAFAPGAQDGRVVGDDMHPAGRRAPGQALRLERAARAVAPASAIPSAGFRAVAGGEPLLRRTSDHIVVGIELEPLGWKALRPFAAGGPKGRNDGFDPAIFERGENPACTVDRVRRDPVWGIPRRFFDDARALAEPARVMFPARDDLHVHHDARVRHRPRTDGGRMPDRPRPCAACRPGAAAPWTTSRRQRCPDRWRIRWQPASGSVRQSFLNFPLVRASRSASWAASTASRWRATSASMLTFARIGLASMWTVSAETGPAAWHCRTTRVKTRRKMSSPRRCRMRVREE